MSNPHVNERGRPSIFSKEKLVETVTEMFWTHGYSNLSLSQIAAKMGLSRSSLYNTFEKKEVLFLECLEYYSAKSPTAKFRNYEAGQKVSPLLYEVLYEICELRFNDKNNRGCLAVNIFHELGNSKTSLGRKLLKRNEMRNKNMNLLMQNAIDQGELPKDTNPSIMANIILSFMSGLNAHAKSGTSKQELKEMCCTFLEKIGFCQSDINN